MAAENAKGVSVFLASRFDEALKHYAAKKDMDVKYFGPLGHGRQGSRAIPDTHNYLRWVISTLHAGPDDKGDQRGERPWFSMVVAPKNPGPGSVECTLEGKKLFVRVDTFAQGYGIEDAVLPKGLSIRTFVSGMSAGLQRCLDDEDAFVEALQKK